MNVYKFFIWFFHLHTDLYLSQSFLSMLGLQHSAPPLFPEIIRIICNVIVTHCIHLFILQGPTLDNNDNWHGFENDDSVTFFAKLFYEINKEETKNNLLNSAVLGILTRFFFWFSSMLKDQIFGVHWYRLLTLFSFLFACKTWI